MHSIHEEYFKDSRVREALLCFDFEWTNKNLFYGAYKRTNSFFENSELASSACHLDKELDYLTPYMDVLPKEIFTSEYNPPQTDGSGLIKNNYAIKTINHSGWLKSLLLNKFH